MAVNEKLLAHSQKQKKARMERMEKLTELVLENPNFNNVELGEQLGLSRNTIVRYKIELRKQGKII